jgi:hypothetical protein
MLTMEAAVSVHIPTQNSRELALRFGVQVFENSDCLPRLYRFFRLSLMGIYLTEPPSPTRRGVQGGKGSSKKIECQKRVLALTISPKHGGIER